MTIDAELVTRKLLLIAADLEQLRAVQAGGETTTMRPFSSWPRWVCSLRALRGTSPGRRASETVWCTTTTTSISSSCLEP